MHMADALISPAVGAGCWALSAGLIAYSSKKVKDELDERKVPLMGVLGAFIFAAQMINFTIPATGSSGHLGGAMLLAVLLGPYGAFLTIASVLTVQAFFFADGGVLALGANIFNLGFFPCFIAYPFIYKKIAGSDFSKVRIIAGSFAASIAGLQLGSFFVVAETYLSGISELSFGTFLLMMQPIHLAIGIVEGAVTASVVLFVLGARPDMIASAGGKMPKSVSIKNVLAVFLTAFVLIGGVFSWFASSHPDGLEWSVFHTTGKEEIHAPDSGVYSTFEKIQEKTSVLPDYSFKAPDTGDGSSLAGTSVSGVVGGFATLLLAFSAGVLLKRRKSGA